VGRFVDFLEARKRLPAKQAPPQTRRPVFREINMQQQQEPPTTSFSSRRQKLFEYIEGKEDKDLIETIQDKPLTVPLAFGLTGASVGAKRASLGQFINVRKTPKVSSRGMGIASTGKTFVDRAVAPAAAPFRVHHARDDDPASVQEQEYTKSWRDLDVFDLANLKVFGNKSFRTNQKRICQLALRNYDIFVLMPTGGGKSLCYQLPATLSPGLCLVISPLLSLINDQVKALVDKDIPATFLSSSQTQRERSAVYKELGKRLPSCKLLYLTPEQFVKSQALQSILKRLHGAGLLSRLVVDEAHCISQWGHDFRVDYKSIGKVKKDLFPGLPTMALTATATDSVCTDVSKTLRMDPKKMQMFKVSFNRPNLFWKVLPKVLQNDNDGIPHYIGYMAEYIKGKWLGCSGIIYCLTRDETEETAMYLREEFGLNVDHYHAGMTTKQRNLVQLSWKAGDTPVICATIAFGMGVDNAHVRFVIHQTMPKSMEGYYQESGRAGRDGNPSEAILLYHQKDVGRVTSLICSGKIKKRQREIQIELLKEMKDFCESRECRRKLVLGYFGERFNCSACNGTCDNCELRLRSKRF
jgi:bloom syndrome protein